VCGGEWEGERAPPTPFSLFFPPQKSAYNSIPSKPARLTWADFIQVAGAAAVVATGGPSIPVALGRPDARRADPGGALPPPSLDAAGLRSLFAANGYTVRDIVAISGSHTIGVSRVNDPKGGREGRGRARGGARRADHAPDRLPTPAHPHSPGKMTATPATFDNSYYKLLLKGGGAFRSDRALVEDPEMRALVQTYARDQGAFFRDFADAYVKMGLKGLAVAA
jgi:peroxidase